MGINNILKQTKKTCDSVANTISNGVGNMKESISDFSILDKVKDYSSRAVDMVGELDEKLAEKKSPYEVGYFRVSGNVSITGGMTLDIYFTKTQTAKSISHEKSKFVSVTNPNTGKSFRYPISLFAGKKEATVRDPLTKELFMVNSKTGDILCTVR
jgi:hypothetical protein